MTGTHLGYCQDCREVFWVNQPEHLYTRCRATELINTKDKTPRLRGSFVKPILGLRQKVPALVSRVFNIFYISSISQIHHAWP